MNLGRSIRPLPRGSSPREVVSACSSRNVPGTFRLVISTFRVVLPQEGKREGERKIPAHLSALFAEPARISDLVPFSRYEYRAVRFGSLFLSISILFALPLLSLSLSLSLSRSLIFGTVSSSDASRRV